MRLIQLIILMIALTGCTGAVSDFVQGGGGTSPGTGDELPSVDLNPDGGFKLSPGSVTATSSLGSMRATITPTMRQMTSPAGNAQMSLSAGRPQ